MSTVSLSQIPSIFLNPDPDTGIDIHTIDLAREPPESFLLYGPEDGSMLAIAWDSSSGYYGTDPNDPDASDSKITDPDSGNGDGDDGSVFLLSLNFEPSKKAEMESKKSEVALTFPRRIRSLLSTRSRPPSPDPSVTNSPVRLSRCKRERNSYRGSGSC
jgi:hypothetical protein